MPYINSAKYGEIIIDNKKYSQVLIIGNSVFEREYDKLKKLFGTSHKIGDWEINKLLSDNVKTIIIGTGIDNRLEVDENLKSKATRANVEIIAIKTLEAINVYNEKIKSGDVNALIHTTC